MKAHRWANGWTAERTDAWRHQAWAPKKEPPDPGVPASTRASAPVPVMLSGYDPDRVEAWQAIGGGWAE